MLCWCTEHQVSAPACARLLVVMGGFLPGMAEGGSLGPQPPPKPRCMGAGVKHTFPMATAVHRSKTWVGLEVLVVMCKVGLVLLVQLLASLLHALRHSRWTTAEHPDLVHLGEEGRQRGQPALAASGTDTSLRGLSGRLSPPWGVTGRMGTSGLEPCVLCQLQALEGHMWLWWGIVDPHGSSQHRRERRVYGP